MEKIYLLTIEYNADYDEWRETRVFATLEKAQQVLKELIVNKCKNKVYEIIEKSDIDFYAQNDEENITMFIVGKTVEQ